VRYAPLFAAFLVGCTTLQVARAPHIAECDGPLLPAAEIPGGDFRLRERVRFEGGGVDLGLELLAERRGDRLVLIGFNGFGARVFSAVQQGTVVESDSPLGRALEISPGNVLRDLHAARFFHPESDERTAVQRSGCDYTATFVRVERRPLR
jgi:Protein of unknown function (DUF3261)